MKVLIGITLLSILLLVIVSCETGPTEAESYTPQPTISPTPTPTPPIGDTPTPTPTSPMGDTPTPTPTVGSFLNFTICAIQFYGEVRNNIFYATAVNHNANMKCFRITNEFTQATYLNYWGVGAGNDDQFELLTQSVFDKFTVERYYWPYNPWGDPECSGEYQQQPF